MKAEGGLALLSLAVGACLSAPQPFNVATDADPDQPDADPNQPDADPNRADGAAVSGDLICDGSSSRPFGKSLFIAPSSGGYAQISDAAHTGLDLTGSFTLEAWLNLGVLPAMSDTYGIVTKDDFGSGERGYTWYLERQGSSTVVRCRVAQGGGARGSEMQWIWSGAEAGRWHHFAILFDVDQSTVQSSLRLMIDGSLVAGTVSNEELDQADGNDNQAPFSIGAWPISTAPSLHFVGAMDEVRVWNLARTPAEIQGSRLAPLNGVEASLVGYWPFDGNLVDQSTDGNDLAGPSLEFCAGPSN